MEGWGTTAKLLVLANFGQGTDKNKALWIPMVTMDKIVAIGSAFEPMATASTALQDYEHIRLATR